MFYICTYFGRKFTLKTKRPYKCMPPSSSSMYVAHFSHWLIFVFHDLIARVCTRIRQFYITHIYTKRKRISVLYAFSPKTNTRRSTYYTSVYKYIET